MTAVAAAAQVPCGDLATPLLGYPWQVSAHSSELRQEQRQALAALVMLLPALRQSANLHLRPPIVRLHLRLLPLTVTQLRLLPPLLSRRLRLQRIQAWIQKMTERLSA